ncbi:Rv1733c family protein [Streptomyces sp. NPDC054841]
MSEQGSSYPSNPHPPHQEHPSKGGNPLRRTSDRIESWFLLFLMLVLVCGLPVAALSAGLTAYASAMRVVHVQSAERQEVTARLVSAAEGTQSGARSAMQRAQVRWTGTDGSERTGTARVKSGTPKGATVRVWVDRDGTIRSRPMTADGATAAGWLVGSVTAIAVATGVFGARAGMRLVLDRGRYAQWDTEWDLVEPSWSARFRQ